MRMKMPHRVLLAAALACAGAAGAQPEPHFAAQAPVQLHSDDGLHRLTLPLQVLQHVQRQDLADVRIVDARGRAAPLAWAPPPQGRPRLRYVEVPRFAWPAPPSAAGSEPSVQVQVDAQGAVVRIDAGAASTTQGTEGTWLLDLSQAAHRTPDGRERLAGLRVHWDAPPQGAQVHVTVEASEDLRQWRRLTEAMLLDAPGAGAASGERLSLREIDLPASTHAPAYLRLRLSPAVALQGVDARLQRSDEAVAALERTVVRFEPEPDGDGTVRRWTLDLGGPVPLRRLQIELPQPNTVASFRLERRVEGRTPWQPVTSFTSYRLHRDGRELLAPPVELPPVAPTRHWRLQLTGRGPDLGPTALDAQVQWPAPQLVFAARGEPPFMLRVGAAEARPDDLPIAQLVPAYREGDEWRLPQASLGALTTLAAPDLSLVERLAASTPQQRRRWLLWGVLVVAVGLLAWLARRLLRDLDARPGPPGA